MAVEWEGGVNAINSYYAYQASSDAPHIFWILLLRFEPKLIGLLKVSRPASQNTLKRRSDESRRRIYARKYLTYTR